MSSVLERLWKDRMDVYRWTDNVVNNVTKSVENLLYTDVKCKYSKGSLTDAEEGVPNIKNRHTLICGIDTDLKEGDEIIVTQRTGKKVTLSVGEGFPFSNHMEFDVKRSDTA